MDRQFLFFQMRRRSQVLTKLSSEPKDQECTGKRRAELQRSPEHCWRLRTDRQHCDFCRKICHGEERKHQGSCEPEHCTFPRETQPRLTVFAASACKEDQEYLIQIFHLVRSRRTGAPPAISDFLRPSAPGRQRHFASVCFSRQSRRPAVQGREQSVVDD